MLNAYPVEDKQDGSLPRYLPDVLIDVHGRLHRASEVGAGMPYEAPPSYEEQIAQFNRATDKILKAFKTNQFPPEDPLIMQASHDAIGAMDRRNQQP